MASGSLTGEPMGGSTPAADSGSSSTRRNTWLLLAVFGLSLLLVSPELMPTYLDINAFDEAKYIESGRLLLLGQPRNLAWGPLISLIYAPLHLVFGNSPNWFVLEARAGQFLLYAGLWLSTLYLALQMRRYTHPLVVAGVLFVSPGFFGVLSNPSDAVFASLSALSLAKLLAFRESGSTVDLAWGSSLLGMAILARFEGVILIPIFVGAALFKVRVRVGVRDLAAGLMPAASIVGAYFLAFGLLTGNFGQGIGSKSYTAFVMNEPIPGGGRPSDKYARSIELYGTSEENQHSVIRAALKNPRAFVNRLYLNALKAPDLYLDLFTKQFGPALGVFALLGAVSLALSHRYDLLAVFGLWALQPAVSLAFLPLHLIKQVVYLPLVFGAIGLSSVAANRHRLTRSLALALLLLMALYGLLDYKLALTVAGLLPAAALLLGRLGTQPSGQAGARGRVHLFLLLAAGLLLRPPFSFPNYARLGESPQEAVVHYLQEELPPNSLVLENLPLPAVAAKLREVNDSEVPGDLESAEALHDWLTSRQIRAVYLGSREGFDARVTRFLEEGMGTYFAVGFTNEDGSQRVFLVRERGE